MLLMIIVILYTCEFWILGVIDDYFGFRYTLDFLDMLILFIHICFIQVLLIVLFVSFYCRFCSTKIVSLSG